MPNLNWTGLMNRMGLQRVDTVLVAQPTYYQTLDSLLAATPISLIKDRLTLDLLSYNARLLSKEFEQTNFDFYGKTLYGQPQLAARWKRMAKQIDTELDDALDQL